jgi:hypothetical protein
METLAGVTPSGLPLDLFAESVGVWMLNPAPQFQGQVEMVDPTNSLREQTRRKKHTPKLPPVVTAVTSRRTPPQSPEENRYPPQYDLR